MRTNIYIRKENEEAWLGVADKSAFVNRAIIEHQERDRRDLEMVQVPGLVATDVRNVVNQPRESK